MKTKGIPLLVKENYLLLGRGYRIYRKDLADGEENMVAAYRASFPNRLLAATPLGCRVAREGIQRLYESPAGDWLAIAKGKILFKPAGSRNFVTTNAAYRGSRPLFLTFDPDLKRWYFGEYFSNPEREAVQIFESHAGDDWHKVYTFPAGSIRHVHNIVYDPYRKGCWVLTGDSDAESGLWFTGDGFSSLERVYSGSQAYRAVDIFVTEHTLLVPSDTPMEANAIRRIELPSGNISTVAELASSAFHSLVTPFGRVVTTVGEPSACNDELHARLYLQRPGSETWELKWEARRDQFSDRSVKVFRYPELIPVGTSGDGKLFCVGIGLKSCGYGLVIINLVEIQKKLN